MIWIAPTAKDAALGKRLWDAADTATRVSAIPKCEATRRDFRGAKDHWSANSNLKSGGAEARFDYLLNVAQAKGRELPVQEARFDYGDHAGIYAGGKARRSEADQGPRIPTQREAPLALRGTRQGGPPAGGIDFQHRR